MDDFIGSVFGEQGQLTVVGWDGERNKNSNKLYKVHCIECAKDPELFGDGCFYSYKGSLIRGCVPCGCAKSPWWTEEQYKTKIKRKCEEFGDLEFLGFSEELKGVHTKLKLQCNKHNEPDIYNGSSIDNFLRGKVGCHQCQIDIIKNTKTKPDQEVIDSFLSSGRFKEGTKFYRSNRKNSQGKPSYWNYTCPVCSNDEYVKAGLCSGVFESTVSDLLKGKLPCRCSTSPRWTPDQREYQINKRIKEENLPYEFLGWAGSCKNGRSKFRYICERHSEQEIALSNFLCGLQGCPQCVGQNQQECYINGVYDSDVLVALKFGIANNSAQRIKNQNKKSIFSIRQLKVFTLSSAAACKEAEKACKEELQCSILSKSEMPDGWTETTSPLNMEKIIDIYKRFGGIDK